MFYSWDMSTDDGWIAGKALEHTMTSATWSTLEKVNLLPEVDVESVEQRVKAMIQSYYSRVQQKDYLVHDSLSDSTTER